MTLTLRVFAVVFGLSFVEVANAALPPGSYDKLRIAAEDAIIIQVTATKVDTVGGTMAITAKAKVIQVERSKNGLKPGDAITIKYSVPTTPIPGPVPTPVVEKDVIYPAFMNKTGADYQPAAHGWTFKMTPEH
jgi:hypothetical protein